MTNERAIQILENLISIDGDVIIEGEYTEALEMAIRSLQKEQPEVMVEKVCGTCTYWQEGTLDRGQCQAGEPHQTHSAETCERWERHEEIPMMEQPCDTCTNDKGCVTCKNGELWEGKEQPIGIHDIGVEGENGVKPSEDLEEEIKRYEASLPESATVDPFEGYPTLEDVARHFANWQKSQMGEQAEKDTIERAVAWLKDYVKYFEIYDEKGIEEFKKAMEEEK